MAFNQLGILLSTVVYRKKSGLKYTKRGKRHLLHPWFPETKEPEEFEFLQESQTEKDEVKGQQGEGLVPQI